MGSHSLLQGLFLTQGSNLGMHTHTHTHLLLLKYLFTFGLIMSMEVLSEVVQYSVRFLFPSVALRGVSAPEVCHRQIDTMTEISNTLEL